MPPLRRLALPFLLVPALSAASLAVAGPAAADVTGSTSTDDVVLYDHCQQHPVSYDLQIGPLTPPWRVEFQVFDPAGSTSEGTVLNSATNPPTTGTFPVTFCGSEPAGTYTVRATVRYAPVNLEVLLPTTTFQVRPARTRTTASRTALGRGRYQVTAHVREQDETGFGRAEGVTVRLERLVRGEWRKVRGAGTLTTVRGKVTTTLGGRPGSTVRAVVPGRNNYAASASRPVRL